LRIDPDSLSAKRGLAFGQFKIAETETESEANPAQALKDIEAGLQGFSSLPKEARESLKTVRSQDSLLQFKADALIQLGEYSEANALADEIVKSSMHRAAADPKDLRALGDLMIAYAHKIDGLETAADRDLGATAAERRRNLDASEKPLTEEIAVLEKMLKLSASQGELKPYLADADVHLGSIQFILHNGGASAELVKAGLATFRDMAKRDQISTAFLDMAAQDFLIAEPASLKDPRFAVSCAERAVALSHRKMPSRLLTLAQAYRAAGRIEKSRSAAKEGLALLPAPQPGSVKPRIRKLLEIQAQS
jgi:tetratricopeptide (TPR) repeat protein